MKPQKSKLRRKIEDGVLLVVVSVIVVAFLIARSNLIAEWKATAQGTAWEPVLEFLTIGER